MVDLKKIFTLLLILGTLLIVGCVGEQAVQPEGDEIITPINTIEDAESGKSSYSQTMDIDGYQYVIGGDVSGPISATLKRNKSASSQVKIGDKIVYAPHYIHVIEEGETYDIISTSWHDAVNSGTVTNLNDSTVTIGEVEVPRDRILDIIILNQLTVPITFLS